jgi:methionyl-tRNA synthetase
MQYYQNNPDAIGPHSRRNEVLSFLQSGLHDLAVSRSKITWGIPVPGSTHVMYVWVDALTNYLTALGYPDTDSTEFQNHWPASTHLMGKDILRFHAVYWPALLMAAGLQPPKRLFAHGWWMSEGQKMSKSIGNVIDPFALISEYGVDRVRYFLFRHVRFGQDGDFSMALFHQRCDHELADGLGNLAHRVLSFIQNRLDGVLPQWYLDSANDGAVETLHWAANHYPLWRTWMDEQNIYAYLESIYSGIQKGNAYMADLAPWTLLKSNDPMDHQVMASGLYALVSLLRDLAMALWPIIPSTAESLWTQVGMPGTLEEHAMPGGGCHFGPHPLHDLKLPQPCALFSKLLPRTTGCLE